MSFSFKLKSHPEKELMNHLYNVANVSIDIINSKSINNKDLFSQIAYLNGLSHDFGKSTTAFQNYIRDPNEKNKFTYHSFISSLFGYYLIKDYLEQNSLLDDFWYLPPIMWIVINKHHGNINNLKHSEIHKLEENNKIDVVTVQIKDINKNHLDEIKNIYKGVLSDSKLQDFFNILMNKDSKFTKEIYKNVKKLFKAKELKYYFLILFFYSILLDADKLDASELERIPKRVEILEKDLLDQYKSARFKNHGGINQMREKAYQEVNSQLSNINLEIDRILSINLPTGVGKTLTSFSFALKLKDKVKKEKNFNPKIIYSLPFLSIIDQNSSVISEILSGRDGKGWDELKTNKEKKEIYLDKNVPSNLLLKHHHLIDIKYREEKDNELNIIEDINKSLILTEGWHSEIVITTFIQFFHSLITNKNRSARKFHNMVNSIIILDEIQSIPHKYWLLLNKMLKYLASEFNCWVIFITATKPLIFDKEEIKELVNNRDTYFQAFDRVDFNFDLNEKDFDDFKEEIFDEIIEEKDRDIMVVLNTINSSKGLYNHLKEKIIEEYGITTEEKLVDDDGICNFPDLELINMTTHVLPFYRLNRINRIKNDKKKKIRKRKIIITTQLVEAGVDISVDTIYRDLAPLDSIIQTAGRCNRNDEGKRGIVNTVILKDEKNEFYKYVYDSVLIDITKEIMVKTGGNISEKNFTMSAADEYYHLVKERGTSNDSREIIDHLIKLEFSDTSKFQLIEKDMPTASIFIEINEEAERIRELMEQIQDEFELFERKNKLLEIRKHINSFTLSISYNKKLEDEIGHLPSIGMIDDYKYVPKKNLDEWYKLDIGFWPPESDIEMRMI